MTSRVESALRRLGIRAERHGNREWIARCPAHDDRHPSWRIVDDRHSPKRNGLHVCKSCGFGGNLVALVQHVLGYEDWRQARDWLAEDGVGPEVEVSGAVEFRATAGPLGFALPAGVLTDPLDEWLPVVREYAHGRGLTSEQVARWGLGYALMGRLAGRLVLPVRSAAGQLLSYSARLFAGSGQKYLTPHPSEAFVRGAVFGEQHWPPLVVDADGRTYRPGSVFVCEGALNALAVERALPGSRVGILDGSEPHPLAVAKLASFESVVLVTDPDKAGTKAAAAMCRAVARYSRASQATLPAGRDANDLDRDDRDLLRDLLRSASTAA